MRLEDTLIGRMDNVLCGILLKLYVKYSLNLYRDERTLCNVEKKVEKKCEKRPVIQRQVNGPFQNISICSTSQQGPSITHAKPSTVDFCFARVVSRNGKKRERNTIDQVTVRSPGRLQLNFRGTRAEGRRK